MLQGTNSMSKEGENSGSVWQKLRDCSGKIENVEKDRFVLMRPWLSG